VADITAQLRNKSDAESQFHLDNNRWPDDHKQFASVRIAGDFEA
jgi:hypothetical protein